MMSKYFLVQVFQACAPFLTSSDLINIAYVCKHFYHHFKTEEIHFQIYLSTLSDFLCQNLNSSNFAYMMRKHTGITLENLSVIPSILKYARNKIGNPYGASGFACWNSKNDGGDGWTIDTSMTYKAYPSCYASSYQWGDLVFEFGLPKFVPNSTLFAGSPIARRDDCGGTASVEVKVTGKNGSIKSSVTVIGLFTKRSNGKSPWRLLAACVDLDQNDIVARIKFSGKSQLWWEGFYGTKFGYCFARIIVNP